MSEKQPQQEVKIVKDERGIEFEDGKYIMSLNQIQEYDAVTINNMVKEWQEGLEKYNKWLEEFDDKRAQAIVLMGEQLEEQKQGRLIEVAKSKEEVMKELYDKYLEDKKEQLVWIENFDKHLKEGKKTMGEELDKQKQAVLSKVDFFKRGLELWSPAVKSQ